MSRIDLTDRDNALALQPFHRSERAKAAGSISGLSARSASLTGAALALILAFVTPGSLIAGPDSGLFLAQAQPGKTDGGFRLDPKSTRNAGSRDSRSTRSNSNSGSRTARTSSTAGSSKAGSAPGSEGTSDDAAETSADAPSKGFVASFRGWIREYATWIVSILAFVTAGVFAWVFLGRSRSGSGDEVFADLGEDESTGGSAGSPGRRYSTTRIRASEVNARVQTDEFEADQDYALVVDEEALKKPDIDEHTGRVYEDSTSIESLLGEQKFEEAYEAYVARVEEDGDVEFRGDVEKSLGDHLLEQKDFDRAARVLEHHVATHSAEDVDAETYFNLGYVHFFARRAKKSRRFLKLYVENENVPERADRAKRILETLEASGPMS